MCNSQGVWDGGLKTHFHIDGRLLIMMEVYLKLFKAKDG